MSNASRAVTVLIVSGIVALGGFFVYFNPGDPAVSCQGKALAPGDSCIVMTTTSQEKRTWAEQADALRSTQAKRGLTAGVAGTFLFLAAAGYLTLRTTPDRD